MHLSYLQATPYQSEHSLIPSNQSIHFCHSRSTRRDLILGRPNEKNRAPTNNNNRMAGSELGLLWGEEESPFERENWIPCWSLGIKDERKRNNKPKHII
ncbi:hypothetical protein CDAR_241801 [Caerostris darwini]|uniref:Ycf15 n=1 Tax=Caerostris darwini TaxID=1538125 RepID=A0AAV4NMZ1_9ARAC|nr:hypothetical protein CDAR_241801 [Caerostris darwini]